MLSAYESEGASSLLGACGVYEGDKVWFGVCQGLNEEVGYIAVMGSNFC